VGIAVIPFTTKGSSTCFNASMPNWATMILPPVTLPQVPTPLCNVCRWELTVSVAAWAPGPTVCCSTWFRSMVKPCVLPIEARMDKGPDGQRPTRSSGNALLPLWNARNRQPPKTGPSVPGVNTRATDPGRSQTATCNPAVSIMPS
jgi:hypothetical protein